MAEIPSEDKWRERTTTFGSVVRLSDGLVDDCLRRGADEVPDALKMAISELADGMGRTIAINGMTPSEKKLFANSGAPIDFTSSATIGLKVYAKAKEDRDAYLSFVTMRLKEAVDQANSLRSDLIALCSLLKKDGVIIEDCPVPIHYWADQGEEKDA